MNVLILSYGNDYVTVITNVVNKETHSQVLKRKDQPGISWAWTVRRRNGSRVTGARLMIYDNDLWISEAFLVFAMGLDSEAARRATLGMSRIHTRRASYCVRLVDACNLIRPSSFSALWPMLEDLNQQISSLRAESGLHDKARFAAVRARIALLIEQWRQS